MASWFTHAFLAGALVKTQPSPMQTTRFWVLSVLCSIVPDADVLGFFWGIGYSHPLGHRGFFHSMCFAMGLGFMTVMWGFPQTRAGSKMWWLLVVHFFLVTVSHGVLDAMTNGGLGVAFFAPFDQTRYFFPWRPLVVSPIGSGFFSLQGLYVLASEILFVWVPILFMVKAVGVVREKRMAWSAAKPENIGNSGE